MDILSLLEKQNTPKQVAEIFVNGLEERQTNTSTIIMLNYFVGLTSNSFQFGSHAIKRIQSMSINDLSVVFPMMPQENKCKLEFHDKLVKYLCELAHQKRFLLPHNQNADNWLVMSKKFLQLMVTQKQSKLCAAHLYAEDFNNVGARLCLPFAIAFSKIFQSGIEDAKYLQLGREYCQDFLNFTEVGVRSPFSGFLITSKICGIHEKSLVYLKGNIYRKQFLLSRLVTQNCKIRNRFLEVIINILDSRNEYPPEDFRLFIDFMLESYNDFVNKFLIENSKKSVKLYIKSLQLLQAITDTTLSDTQMVILFFKIFDRYNLQIILSDYYIELLKITYANETHQEMKILRSIFELYCKYHHPHKSVHVIADLVFDNFTHMHKFENLLMLFAMTKEFDGGSALIAQFIVAMVQKYTETNVINEYDNLKKIVKKLPLVLEKNEGSLITYNNLLAIFTIIDMRIYSEPEIDAKYYNRLLKSFGFMIHKCQESSIDDEILLCNILSVLRKFSDLQLRHANDLLKFMVAKNWKIYTETFYMMENAAEAVKVHYTKLTKAILFISLLMAYEVNDVFVTWPNIFAFVQKSFLSKSLRKMSKIHSDYQHEAYCIQFYYEFLKKYYQHFQNIHMTIAEYANFCHYCHDLLKYITTDSDVFVQNGLCLAEKAITSLLQVQSLLLIPNSPHVKNPRSRNYYPEIYDVVSKFLFAVMFDENKFLVDSARRSILEMVIQVQAKFKVSSSIWKIIVHFGSDHMYNSEINDLIIELLKNDDDSYFPYIYAYMLYKLATDLQYSTNLVLIHAMRRLLKRAYPVKKKNTSNPPTITTYKAIEGVAVIYLINYIEKNICNRSPEMDEQHRLNIISENLLLPLTIINPLLEHFRPEPRKKFLKQALIELQKKGYIKMNIDEEVIFGSFVQHVEKLC